MKEDFVYQVKIKCDDGIVLLIYTNGRKDEEEIILDFMYQEYYDLQPDKSKYKVLNLSKDYEDIVNTPHRIIQLHLAHRILEYSGNYN